MRGVIRSFKRHYGASAKRVAIRSRRPWYWRLLLAALLVSLGYLLSYWQLIGGFDAATLENLRQENKALNVSLSRTQGQLQVARSAEANLAKELKALQDESMRLKEDVAFYNNILSDNTNREELKFYSFRLSKSSVPGQYDYSILLTHSPGPHKKSMRGRVQFTLYTSQGKTSALTVSPKEGGKAPAIDVDFKYYQRLEGSLSVAEATSGDMIEASFIESGASQSKISQKVDLPI